LLAVYPSALCFKAGLGSAPAGPAIGSAAPWSGDGKMAKRCCGPTWPWRREDVRFSVFYRDFESGCDMFAYNCTTLALVPMGFGSAWSGRCAHAGTPTVRLGPDGRMVCPTGRALQAWL